MRKIFLAIMLFLVVSVFGCVATVNAMTEAERQSAIAQIIAQIAQLQAILNQMVAAGVTDSSMLPSGTASTTSSWCHTFNTNMKYGDSGSEVSALQHALQLQSLFSASDSETVGSFFGTNTYSAVVKFQEKYRSEILTPQGLTKGTGTVATGTRSKLNKLYGCSSIVANPITSVCNPNWQCSVWGTCVAGQQTRVCLDYNSCNSASSSRNETQYCSSTSSNIGSNTNTNTNTNTSTNTGVCYTNWQCTNWGPCINSVQSKTCTDYNFCQYNLDRPKPTETQYCTSTSSSTSNTNLPAGCTSTSGYSSTTGQSCSGTTTSTSTNTNINTVCTPNWNCPTTWSTCSGRQQSRICAQTNCSSLDLQKTETRACCTPDWSCSSWGSCFANQQTRTCYYDNNNCNQPDSKPVESRACNCAPNWRYEEWGTCIAGQQTRTIKDYNNCGIDPDFTPVLSQSCVCVPRWDCADWGECQRLSLTEGEQTRTCTDANRCGTLSNKPDEIQSCVPQAIIPTVNISSNGQTGSVTVAYGSRGSINWFTNDYSNCYTSGDWNVAINSPSGVEWYNNITSTKTYTLTCRNPAGSVSATVTINIGNPAVNIKANNSDGPLYVPSGTDVYLSWTTTYISSCSASGNWSPSYVNPNGSDNYFIGSATSAKIYNITCSDSSGKITTDTVSVIPTKPTVDIKANNLSNKPSDGPVDVKVGNNTILSWAVANATSCTASANWSGAKTALATNSESTAYYEYYRSYMYIITCEDALKNSATDSVTVNVVP